MKPDKVEIAAQLRSQYDALSIGADVLYKVRGVHLQAEVVTQQRRYTDDGRVSTPIFFAPAAVGFPRDALSWGGYLLVAYELPWYALTPYLDAQHSQEIL